MSDIICTEGISDCTNQVSAEEANRHGWTNNAYGWTCPQCATDLEARKQQAKQAAADYKRSKHPLLRG